MSGKGDKRRPTFVSREEEDLRWKLFQGTATEADRKKLDELIKERIERK
jgi:hypothetical protein